MSSIYIHIPFCKRRCHYCDFYREVYRPGAEPFFCALGKEMEYRRDYLGNTSISTIYFGGGTPSLYHPSRLQGLIEKAATIWEFESDMEITTEINPDDATDEYFEALKKTDINRVSFGVQSFIDRDLALLGRRHNAEQAKEAILTARKMGFKNISIDLMYGIPGMSNLEWEKNVLKAIALGVDHISAYMLTVEQGTPIAEMIDMEEIHAPSDEDCEEQYLDAHQLLTDAGFDHYEVSNYSRDPWLRSRHNSNYWCGDGYLGLGPSAHSYNGKSRTAVVSDVDKYIDGAGNDSIYTTENLSRHDRYNEYVMVSLRTSTGVQRDKMTRRFGVEGLLYFEFKAQAMVERGLMVREGNEYKIPPEKYMLSDAIIRELFYEEEE